MVRKDVSDFEKQICIENYFRKKIMKTLTQNSRKKSVEDLGFARF